MKTNAVKTFVFILSFLPGSAVLAQSHPYVTSARLKISLTHQLWPDVYLNGQEIINAEDHLFDPQSSITLNLSKDQLCAFLTDNCLGVEVDQTLGTSPGTNAMIGLAYSLKITLSNHRIVWINSDDGQVKKYHIKKDGTKPRDWANFDYNDSAWGAAEFFKPTSMAVTLINPKTKRMAKYFPTYQDNPGIYQSLGEKIYFRRKFSLDVTTRPDCGASPEEKTPPTPTTPLPLVPTATLVIRFIPTSTFTPWPTSTPLMPRPTLALRPIWTMPPIRTATPRPRIRRKPTVTPTDTPEMPAATFSAFIQQMDSVTPQPVRHQRPTVTPTEEVATGTFTAWPTNTLTPLPIRRKRPTATPTAPIVTATFTALPQDERDMASTIVFDNPPVNIDASFADGPGRYQLEIVDSQENQVKQLYNQSVGFYAKEIWISWDGTNDQGQPMPNGRYVAIFSKDGVVLEKIAIIRIPSQN